MSSPLLPSMDEQLDAIRVAEGWSIVHIDTCLPCYLQDHHNRDGELLLGVYVDGNSTVKDVLDGLDDEFRSIAWDIASERAGYDDDKASAVLAKLRQDNADKLDALFDSSLEVPSEEEDGFSESCYAWFLLVWPIPDEEDDASAV